MTTPRTRPAIAGVARTPFYRRGESDPQTQIEMACEAILAAVADAGMSVDDLEGFVHMSGGLDSAYIAEILGIPEVKFTVTLTGGGGKCPGVKTRSHTFRGQFRAWPPPRAEAGGRFLFDRGAHQSGPDVRTD